MKRTGHPPSSRLAPSRELAALRARVAEAEETLRAIRTGEVDAVVVANEQGARVFTLDGAGEAYRALIESMNEGALTLTADGVILYANQCFARMIQRPLEQVISCSIQRFLSAADQSEVQPLLRRATRSGARIQAQLQAGNSSGLPVLMSVRPLATPGAPDATFGMVVTDMTEVRRSEERLQALSRRLVDAQEAERRQVAVVLHENISQLTYAILLRCDSLARKMPTRAHAARAELLALRDLLDQATDEVRRIAHGLRPSTLDDLGLIPALRVACEQFGERARVEINLDRVRKIARLPAAAEMALYRILQEALQNVEHHARATHVAVCVWRQGQWVRLAVTDDGIGFAPDRPQSRRGRERGLGFLAMRERAAAVGGALEIRSGPSQGTTIRVQVPVGKSPARGHRTEPANAPH